MTGAEMGQNVTVFVFESEKVIATVPKSPNGGDNGKDHMNITPMTKELQTLVERKLNYINHRHQRLFCYFYSLLVPHTRATSLISRANHASYH